ncbi:MAG: 50S ribosomal protein L9 [Gammaproteobacteria bacterium]|nr:50S ribosomal protein L9 [Gammaproteobacteria bacterium]MYF59777.1 50S ribosomal protein L9 [Gammaproteobacteria bacterium]
MRIILLETVESLGGIGDIVDVRAGYGRNYLLPQGKAAPATEEQIAAFEERRSELMAMERERMAATTARAAQVQAVLPLTIVANAGPVGKLYGSVGPAEISAGFEEAGVEVSRSEVQMPDGPIKELGEHPVTLKLHADVQQEATIRVVGQAGETEVLPGAEPLPADEDEDAETEDTLPTAADAATDTAGEVRESESTADEEVEETAGAEPQVLADDSAGDG